MDGKIKARLVRAYDGDAHGREERGKRAWELEERGAFLARLRQEDRGDLLDIGAGPGYDSLAFVEAGLRVVSLDLSPEMMRFCRGKGLCCTVADLYAMPFRDRAFAAAWAMRSLLHVPKAHLATVLEEVARVLEAGALLFLGLYRGDRDGPLDHDPLTPPRHFAFYQAEELHRIAATVFAVEQLAERELPGGFGFLSLTLRRRG